MSCGKRPTMKLWEHPRKIRRIAASKYEQNEPSVKLHWKNKIKDLEDHYRDDKFWASQSEVVRELVGRRVFKRLQKIFDLPPDKEAYEPPPSPEPSVVPTEQFYLDRLPSIMTQASMGVVSERHSTISDMHSYMDLEEREQLEKEANEAQEEADDKWTLTSSSLSAKKSKSIISKTFLSFSKKSMLKTAHSSRSMMFSVESDPDEECSTNDDLIVHHGKDRSHHKKRNSLNPHYQLLFCNESETDMIKWKSQYKQKSYEISASDEFSKKAELITNKICNEFFDWWTGMGVYEFKSEIKRPEDIEALFQVWFEEHASRGLILHPKILPCVLPSIADAALAPELSCRYLLKEEIACDIYAEKTPAHTMAFGTTLPHKMKHLPPQNNTLEVWKSFPIPEELRSMAFVWDDIRHLTSTKAFCSWLEDNPKLLMPPCFVQEEDVKALFTQPSDYYLGSSRSSRSVQELALPVSQISVEMKTVLSKIMS